MAAVVCGNKHVLTQDTVDLAISSFELIQVSIEVLEKVTRLCIRTVDSFIVEQEGRAERGKGEMREQEEGVGGEKEQEGGGKGAGFRDADMTTGAVVEADANMEQPKFYTFLAGHSILDLLDN